jgi:hypothetical protein
MELEPTSIQLAALQSEMDEILKQASASPELADFVRSQGGSEDDLRILRGARPFSAQYIGAPLDPVTTAILIKAAIGLGSKIAYDVWKKFILPRLEAKYGADKIKERR